MSDRPGDYLHQVFDILGLRRQAKGGLRRAATALGDAAQAEGERPGKEEAAPCDEGGTSTADKAPVSDRQAFETGLRQFRTLRATAGYVAGRVHMLNTDLVRERLGARWPRLEQRIHEIIRGELKRRLSPHDLFTRVNESSYVIVFGDCSELDAQVKIALLSERLLEKLLGEEEARNLDALGVQRLITQANGAVAREALQSTEAMMAMLDRAQAAEPQPQPYHCSDVAAGRRAVPPQAISDLAGRLDQRLQEIVGNGTGPADDGLDRPGAGGPVIKIDRLRQLVRQLEELEEALDAAGTDAQGCGHATSEEATLGWVRDLKGKAERQLAFVYDQDPGRAASGAAPGEPPQLDFAYLPLWHAPSRKVGVYLCQAAVRDSSGRNLLPRETAGDDDRDAVAAADRLLLRRVLEEIERGGAEKSPAILAAPLHFSSLQPERSRVRLLELCRGLADSHRSRLLWEILRAPIESWSFQLPDILQQLKRVAPAIFLRLDGVENHFAEIRRAFRHLRPAGVLAVGLDVGQLHGSETEQLGLLEKVARGANEHGLKCYGHGFESESLALGAVELGFQQVSGPAIARPLPRPAGIQTVTPDTLGRQLVLKQAGGSAD
ncbi:MAG: hypothetical protein ACFCUQ_14515 [Kiloniellales bacterium]